MSCEIFERMVSDRLGESLSEADERRLEAHLGRCEACALDAQMAEDAVEAARLPPPTLEERAAIARLRDPLVLEARRGSGSVGGLPSRIIRWSVPGLGAAIAAGLVLILTLHRTPAPRPAVAVDDGDELVAWALNDPTADILAPGDSSSDDDLASALSDDGTGDLDDDGAAP
jgi:anti-sigma factor RsiW